MTKNFVQNDNTKTFVQEVKNLVQSGIEPSYKVIADKLKWHNNAMSLVMGGSRNVPAEVFKRYTEIYKGAKPVEPPQTADYKDKYIALLEKQAQEKETLLRVMEQRFQELTSSLAEIRANQFLIASYQKGYQDFWIETIPPEGYTPDQVKKAVSRKAGEALVTLEKGLKS